MISTLLTCISPTALADQAYGPVQSNDTLGKIVNRFYVGSNRSTMSLMRIIVENNPKAFVRGDMNLLKKGALLQLPGDDWLVNEASFTTPDKNTIAKLLTPNKNQPLSQPSRANKNNQQVQDRLVFLEAERTSLISEVSQLKRDNLRLEKKIQKLESQSKESDEQLRLLDAEIIRLTSALENKSSTPVLSSDLAKLDELQQKLTAVQNQTQDLKQQLLETQSELANNQYLKQQADKTIIQLTQENKQLNHLIQESQPGVHYYADTSGSDNISLLGGKVRFPLWGVITGGALLSLIIVAMISTRRRKSELEPTNLQAPENTNYNNLLESEEVNIDRGFAQSEREPEENVFKMFDEGSLEMDLKLDMAKAYLEVDDFKSARSVLQEVIDGGSELQQRKANRLMKQAA